MSGSSIGSLIGGIVGFALAPFTGGASLLVTSLLMAGGSAIGNLIDPPKGPHIYGPRLSDKSQQTSTYGAVIGDGYGTFAVLGNVFWIENNEVKETLTTTTGGGKGGPPEQSQTTASYYGTFAVGLMKGQQPVDGIKRIWISGKLLYNALSTDAETILVNEERKKYFKYYDGSDTQMPDTRMQADVGADNCPAYRGLAYIVFYDLPLADYGNSIAGAQVKVELVSSLTYNSTITSPGSVSVDNNSQNNDIAVYGNYAYQTVETLARIAVYDITNPANMQFVVNVSTTSNPRGVFVYKGNLYVVYGTSTSSSNFRIFSLANPALPVLISTITTLSGSCFNVEVKDDFAYIGNASQNKIEIFDTGTLLKAGDFTTNWPGNFKVNGYYIYVVNTNSNVFSIYDITSKSAGFLVSSMTITNWPKLYDIEYYNNYVYLVGSQANPSTTEFLVIDVSNPYSPTIVNTVPSRTISGRRDIDIFDKYLHIISDTGEYTIYDLSDPVNPVLKYAITASNNFYRIYVLSNSYSFGLVGTSSLSTIVSFNYYDTVTENQPTLGDIVQAECIKSKLLTAADIDVTELTQPVRGYSVANIGAIRSSIELLQGAWPFDVIQDGYKLKFTKRGKTSVATISYDKLDARVVGTSPGVQITSSREMESQLPSKVIIKFFQWGREYDTGEQHYQRINTDAVHVMNLELPIVLRAFEAARIAQQLLYLYWLERYDISFKLPPEYNQLQPADVITLTSPSASYNLRLNTINYSADGVIECRAKYNRPAVYDPTAEGDEGQEPVDTLLTAGDTKLELLDIPTLQDVYNKPGYPVAVTGTGKGWPGGLLYRSDDSGVSYTLIQAYPQPGSTMGFATNSIGNAAFSQIDKTSVLNVTLYGKGELFSVTEAQMLNGQNHFAYGVNGRYEIIAAQNCVLQGDGTYKLSDLLRGRFGTEQYAGSHAINDKVVLMNSASVAWLDVNTSVIGSSRLFKAIKNRDILSNATAASFTYNGVNLKPLSPIYLNGDRDNPASGDWTLTWIRRTRVDGEWRSLVDAGLGETSESYEVEIFSDNTFTTLKRTLTATTASVVYSAAQQVTDFGSNQATLYVRIYQMSAVVGRGYPLETNITR